LEPTT